MGLELELQGIEGQVGRHPISIVIYRRYLRISEIEKRLLEGANTSALQGIPRGVVSHLALEALVSVILRVTHTSRLQEELILRVLAAVLRVVEGHCGKGPARLAPTISAFFNLPRYYKTIETPQSDKHFKVDGGICCGKVKSKS